MASSSSRTMVRAFIALLALATVSVAFAACGEDKESAAEPVDPTTVETAYLEGMAGHHESAIEMAQLAQDRGQSSFVKNLSANIISTQERELGQLKLIRKRLFDSELKPDMGAHDELGLSAAAAGMDHDADTNTMLEKARPFDRAFVDEMVPHHEGAVRMSRVVLKSAKDPSLRNLAESIISTQEREVRAMNAFRTRRYDGPVPEEMGEKMESDKTESDDGGGHGGH